MDARKKALIAEVEAVFELKNRDKKILKLLLKTKRKPEEKNPVEWKEAGESFVEESRLLAEFDMLKKEGCYACWFQFTDCQDTHRQALCIENKIVYNKKEVKNETF